MRSKLVALIVGLGVAGLAATSSFACPYHDHTASTSQQQTAQAAHSDSTTTQ